MNLSIFKITLFIGMTLSSLAVNADYAKYKKYSNRAKKYYKKNNYGNAAEFFLKAEKQAYDLNTLASAIVNRGNCLLQAKKYEHADKLFTSVISNIKTPFNYKTGAMKGLGASLLQQKKYDDAEKVLKKCLGMKNLSIGTLQESLWLLASCFYNTGRLDDAEKVYKHILDTERISPAFKNKAEKKLVFLRKRSDAPERTQNKRNHKLLQTSNKLEKTTENSADSSHLRQPQ